MSNVDFVSTSGKSHAQQMLQPSQFLPVPMMPVAVVVLAKGTVGCVENVKEPRIREEAKHNT